MSANGHVGAYYNAAFATGEYQRPGLYGVKRMACIA
jgi:hypothetical protein